MSRSLSKIPAETNHRFLLGDCLEVLKGMPDDSVDLVFTSPPYEDARLYGDLNFRVSGQEWVDWAVERYRECYRVSRGLVAWVVEGKTRQFRWSATPVLLAADLHRAGIRLRKPPIYFRVGIPGSGGPDWFRNDYELIICASKGRLPWSDNTACGKACKFGPGGALSHRTQDGQRISALPGHSRKVTGSMGKRGRPCHEKYLSEGMVANPGNVIQEDYTSAEVIKFLSEESELTHCTVGGGRMGHKLAHESEAPFPEKLAERFIRSCCPPGGTVLDPFSGSGTTVCVAKKLGRGGIGIEIRPDQIDISNQRLSDPVYQRESA